MGGVAFLVYHSELYLPCWILNGRLHFSRRNFWISCVVSEFWGRIWMQVVHWSPKLIQRQFKNPSSDSITTLIRRLRNGLRQERIRCFTRLFAWTKYKYIEIGEKKKERINEWVATPAVTFLCSLAVGGSYSICLFTSSPCPHLVPLQQRGLLRLAVYAIELVSAITSKMKIS